MKEYKRVSLTVTAAQYEIGKGMEDGFRLYSQVITNDGLVTDGLIQINRGLVFIREGDYIICENNEKHVCGKDKFPIRYEEIK